MSTGRDAEAKKAQEDLGGMAKGFASAPGWTPAEPLACSRCGLLVWSKSSLAGKCLEQDCGNALCWSCWNLEKRRFCQKHAKGGWELDYESKPR